MHAVQCRLALAAGKHVYVEKPFCKTTAEAAQIVAEAEEAGVKLMVSQNARLLYGLPQLVELARSGQLGDITAGLMVKTSECINASTRNAWLPIHCTSCRCR